MILIYQSLVWLADLTRQSSISCLISLSSFLAIPVFPSSRFVRLRWKEVVLKSVKNAVG